MLGREVTLVLNGGGRMRTLGLRVVSHKLIRRYTALYFELSQHTLEEMSQLFLPRKTIIISIQANAAITQALCYRAEGFWGLIFCNLLSVCFTGKNENYLAYSFKDAFEGRDMFSWLSDQKQNLT